ncbi:MAG: OmpA family protein [Gammaproteobacteria bacterium]|nr:OmpA family protein [Gammaproteobacteria bacterium]
MMKMKGIKLFLIASCVVTLAGCHAKKPQDPAAINDANAAYQSAETSGLGEESSFGEEGVEGNQQAQINRKIYFFDFNSFDVHESDKPAIYANANYLMSHPNARVMLEGHTDPRGSREYNIGLGERRAKAVAAILTSRGVNPGQIRIVSYGAEKRAAFGHSEADFQKDRRVVLVYLNR